MFNNLHETSVLYPISLKRIINNAKNLFHMKKTQTDLEPLYVLEEINKITTELYLNNNNKGNKLLQILIISLTWLVEDGLATPIGFSPY